MAATNKALNPPETVPGRRPRNLTTSVSYDAFISYSHKLDGPLIRSLQKRLQSLGKAWWQRRAVRIFRDETSLAAAPELWPEIERALSASRFLILCASPDGAASQWVDKEVRWWLANKGPETILIALIAGELHWNSVQGDFTWTPLTPLPPACRRVFINEPKWVDFRAFHDARDDDLGGQEFLERVVDLSAAIRNSPKEDLLSEEVRQQHRALRVAYSAAFGLAFLTLVAIGFAGWALYNRSETERTAQAAASSAAKFVYTLFGGYWDGVEIDQKRKASLLNIADQLLGAIIDAGFADSPDALRARGAVEVEQADVLLGERKYDEAANAASSAVLAFNSLLPTADEKDSTAEDLAVAYERLGRAQEGFGRPNDAQKSFQTGLHILQRLGPND
jgi:hypothetical protein